MTVANRIDTAPEGDAAASAWETMRAEDDIQFSPVDIPSQSRETPEWMRRLSEWLAEVFEPMFLALAGSWPVLKWVLLAVAIAALLYIIYRIIEPYLQPGDRAEAEAYVWQPDEQFALALLEDADRLASEGKYDAATHLLLQRSVAQIAQARPDWVEPSTTARELASLDALPENARNAFGIIAQRVERSLFALRALNEEDWKRARAAYADFALEQVDGRILDRTAQHQSRLGAASS